MQKINKFLCFAVSIVSFFTIGSGIALSWPSPVIPEITEIDSSKRNKFGRPVSIIEESLVVSLLQLGEAFGCLTTGFIATKIGKKQTLTIFGVLMLTSHLLVSLRKSIDYFYAARFILGLGTSCTVTVVPLFINEMNQGNKKLTSSYMESAFALGVLISYLLGEYMNISDFTFACFFLAVFFLIVFSVFVPGTPEDLLADNDEKCAEIALKKYRNLSREGVKNEFPRFKENYLKLDRRFYNTSTFKTNIRPLLLSLLLVTACQLSGVTVLISYMASILKKTNRKFSMSISLLIIGVIKLYSAIIFSYFMDKLMRKTALVISSFLTCTAMIVLGSYYYFLDQDHPVDKFNWLPTICLIIFISGYNFGLGHITWGYIEQILDRQNNLLGVSIAQAYGKVISFMLTFSFPHLIENYGIASSFWILAFCNFICLAIVFLIPNSEKNKVTRQTSVVIEAVISSSKIKIEPTIVNQNNHSSLEVI